ncbi:MAG: rRNA (guanine966-N2)-methyltransferase [Actinomycetota bacterium]|nr:rRNA (guanine966-N2)-methyltransferase [Actinomycetota bacterium]
MTRIIAGAARGRRLAVPAGDVTRPTSDRVREAVFSALEHRLGGWRGVVVLDLFAGSGAMGLEAASRGAAQVLLVEQDRRALTTLRANAAVVDVTGVTVRPADAWRMGPREEVGGLTEPAGLVLLDPPYREPNDRLGGLLVQLGTKGWLTPTAWALAERPAHSAQFRWPEGWDQVMDRRYGATRIHVGRLVASP